MFHIQLSHSSWFRSGRDEVGSELTSSRTKVYVIPTGFSTRYNYNCRLFLPEDSLGR
ncbi:hypothetical protein K491DRAFT_688293 [Lophiostoma macrostomum CBS 122681]|uniref:Uncharacterized protein n=1 Tax=Lophiostoma macrostomum CBS 122681 TaxID=1314788 RepID=A0A6A6TNS2_9PLEO|nr:hypothetical protein K491DRAFT_688293 [Lophiostoma macrostomum CBS 122681]